MVASMISQPSDIFLMLPSGRNLAQNLLKQYLLYILRLGNIYVYPALLQYFSNTEMQYPKGITKPNTYRDIEMLQ